MKVRNAIAFVLLLVLTYGFTSVLIASIIKEDSRRDAERQARAKPRQQEIFYLYASTIPLKDWYCNPDECCFKGLDYCAPQDKRFDKKGFNNFSAR